jgi:hypothetical protein
MGDDFHHRNIIFIGDVHLCLVLWHTVYLENRGRPDTTMAKRKGQKYKQRYIKNIIQKTKDRATRTPL